MLAMAKHDPQEDAPGVALLELLGRIAAELHANAAQLEACEAAIGAVLPRILPEETCAALQGLDALGQVTRELSIVLDRIVASGSGDIVKGGILNDIRLERLRAALRGDSGVVARAEASSQSVELW